MRTTFTARRPPKKALLLSAWLALAWCTLFTTVCAAEYDEYETTIEYRERIRRHYTSPRYTREIEEAPTEVIDFHQRLRTPKSVLDPERPIDVPPKLVTEDHPIYMVIPLPSTDDISAGRNPFRLSIPLVEPIVDLAVESVYKQQLVQRNSIRVIYKDSQMSDAHGPNVAIDMLVQNKLDVIIGYAYVYALAPVARMAPFWRDIDSNGIPVITPIGLTGNLDDKKEYSMMTRINSPYKNFRQSVEKLWDAYNWTTTVFIYHDRRFGSDLSQPSGECYLLLTTVKIFFKKRVEAPLVHNYFVFNEHRSTRKDFNDYLKQSSMLSNIIILCASPETVREIMLAAYDLGMATSGDYVFINIDVSTGSHAEQPWVRANDSDKNSAENQKAKEAYKALKTISLRRSDQEEYKQFETRVVERANKKYHYKEKMHKEYEMNNFISAFYDAVLLYAIALNETLRDGLDPRNGHNITSKMWGRTFAGITGNVSIDKNGDRYSDYSLFDLDPDRDKFVEVAYYSGAANKLESVGTIHWVGGKPPRDMPICGFDKSKCPKGYPLHVYLLCGAGAAIIILALLFAFFLRRYRLEQELAAMSWKIRWEELDGEESTKKEKKKTGEHGRKICVFELFSPIYLTFNT